MDSIAGQDGLVLTVWIVGQTMQASGVLGQFVFVLAIRIFGSLMKRQKPKGDYTETNIKFPHGSKVHAVDLEEAFCGCGVCAVCGLGRMEFTDTTDPITCKACLKILERKKVTK